jgi:hypothetical protein
MIEWFTWVQVAVAAIVGLVCVVAGLVGKKPNDATLAGLAVVEVLLIAQLVVAIVAPLVGNRPTGNALEFWVYLVSALIVPPAAAFWGLVERTKWSTVILGVAALAIAVMVYRMSQIWFLQG